MKKKKVQIYHIFIQFTFLSKCISVCDVSVDETTLKIILCIVWFAQLVSSEIATLKKTLLYEVWQLNNETAHAGRALAS